MISSKLASEVLKPLYLEVEILPKSSLKDTTKNGIEMTSGEVTSATTSNIYGAGLRILDGFNEVYGYSNDLSKRV